MSDYTAQHSMNLEACINCTHEMAIDNISGTFDYTSSSPEDGEIVEWSTGTGKIWHIDSIFLVLSLISGSEPNDNDVLTGQDSNATCQVNGSVLSKTKMSDGENLVINYGVEIKCTQTPSILMGQTTNSGTYWIDGQNITKGNSINYVIEWGVYISVQGTGLFKITGDWVNIGTTNGANDQSIDLSSTGVDYWNGNFCIEHVPMIQVETGRRIYFDNEISLYNSIPENGDFIVKTSDENVIGRVLQYDANNHYIIVKYLTGILSNDDDFFIEKLVDIGGPYLERAWSATVNNVSGDIKETGVYQEFGNTNANGASYIEYFHHGIGGFVYDNPYQSGTITLGNATGVSGGYVPPSGCNVRTPNVVFTTSDLTSYASGLSYETGDDVWAMPSVTSVFGSRINISIANICNVRFSFSNTFEFEAEYVGATMCFQNSQFYNGASFLSCVGIQDPSSAREIQPAVFMAESIFSEPTFKECLFTSPLAAWNGLRAKGGLIENNIFTAPQLIAMAPWDAHLFSVYDAAVLRNNVIVYNDDIITYQTALQVLSGTGGARIYMTIILPSHDGVKYGTNSDKSMINVGAHDTLICGVKILGDTSAIRGRIFGSSAVNDLRIRAVGQINRPVDTSNMSSIFLTYQGTQRTSIARVNVTNGNLYINSGSTRDLSIKNFKSSYTGAITISGMDAKVSGYSALPMQQYDQMAGMAGNQIFDIFDSDTTGKMYCVFEPPTATAPYVTITAGNPIFSYLGSISMSDGDQLIIEHPDYILGHLTFEGNFTLRQNSDEYLNVEFQYCIDGIWNGTWLNAKTNSNWTDIENPETGIKFKFRLTATGDMGYLTYFSIDTTTSLTAQQDNMHPVDQNYVSITITAKDIRTMLPIEGVNVWISAAAGGDMDEGEIILKAHTNSSGYVSTTTFLYTNDQPISAVLRKGTTAPLYKDAVVTGTIRESGLELIALMIGD